MIIYIRHADDSSVHDHSHIHDTHITKKGIIDCDILSKRLIRRYGKPYKIYHSPLLRGTETTKAMTTLNDIGGKIISDNRLSRYFTKSEQQNPDVSRSSLGKDVPIYENWKDFQQRVKDHMDEMIRKEYLYSKDKVVWCITHTLVIKEVTRLLKIKTPDYLPFLYSFKVRVKI